MPERVREVLPALLTLRETAMKLGCSTSTIRRMVDEGTFEAVRLRPVAGSGLRIRASDVARLVEEPDELEDVSR
jgi:excisionase family DNA binding protein